MARIIPQEVIQEVRSRTNIVDVIRDYGVDLRNNGTSWTGLCPFHKEKSPSFSVKEDIQYFNCFGCHKKGNVFTFVEEMDHISFPEAVVKVAEISGVELNDAYKNVGNAAPKVDSVTSQLIKLHDSAADFYHQILVNGVKGEEALKYLEDRGLSRDIIDEFNIGFAPSERGLHLLFEAQKIETDLMKESGLFFESDDGNFTDRFSDRIMFPVRNEYGGTLGFSGRLLGTPKVNAKTGKKEAKYINTGETKLFHKREILFNFDKAKANIRKDKEVYLFEGQMDVIAAWRAGITNGIASMGTALTEGQIARIAGSAKSAVIAYDGDDAGQNSTMKAIELFTNQTKLNLSILQLPEKLDPDEYIEKYGEESFAKFATSGRSSVFAFKMDYLKRQLNLSNDTDQLTFANELLTDLSKTASILERDKNLTMLAQALPDYSREILETRLNELISANTQTRVNESIIKDAPPTQEFEDFGSPPPDYGYAPPVQDNYYAPPVAKMPNPTRKQYSKVEKAERLLLRRIFHETTIRNQVASLEDFHFVHVEYQELYMMFTTFMEVNGLFDEGDFIDFIKDDQLRDLVTEIAFANFSEESSDQEFNDLLKVLNEEGLKESMQQKQQELNQAKRSSNSDLELQLTIEILELKRKMNSLR